MITPRTLISRRSLVERSLLVMAGIASVSCAAPAAPAPAPTAPPAKPTTAPAAATAATAAPAAATVAPTAVPAKPAATVPATQAPAKQQIAKVSIASSSPGLTYAPLAIARAQKFFEQEAIELDLQQLQGGALVLTALVNGEVQLGGATGSDQLTATEKGLPLITVLGMTTAAAQSMVASKAFMEKRKVTPTSPLADRLQALKGARVGVSTLSGPPAQFTKYLLQSAKLNPETDVEYSVAGQAAARVAALQQGQVDIVVGGSPDPEQIEQGGSGSIYIRFYREIPALQEFMFTNLMGKKDWVEQNGGVVERVCRAVGRANNVMRNDPAAVEATLKEVLPGTSPEVAKAAIEAVRMTFAADGRMTEAMWKNVGDVLLASAAIKVVAPTAEGGIWTNKYIVNVPSR